MIATILILSLAMAYLLKETNFLRIRLEAYAPQSKSEAFSDTGNSKDQTMLKPVSFIPADIPAMSGDNIILSEVS